MSAARRSAARPPRRFAPPLLDEEGKATTPPFPPLLILRRGAREAGGVVQPYRFAAPSCAAIQSAVWSRYRYQRLFTTWLPPSITESTQRPETDAASFWPSVCGVRRSFVPATM